MSKLLSNPRFLLAPLDSSVTCCSDPTRCSVRSHTQNPIGDDGVIGFVRNIHMHPTVIQSIYPYFVGGCRAVIVDVQVTDIWVKVGRGFAKVCKGVGTVPSGNTGGTGRERSLLFDGGDRTCGGR